MRFDYTMSVLLLPPSGGFFFTSLDVEYLQIFVSPPAGVYLGKWNSANHLRMCVFFCPKRHSWRVCSWSSKAFGGHRGGTKTDLVNLLQQLPSHFRHWALFTREQKTMMTQLSLTSSSSSYFFFFYNCRVFWTTLLSKIKGSVLSIKWKDTGHPVFTQSKCSTIYNSHGSN